MGFFESLYKGFEAEHYVAGKLFSVGYEAFKLPGDFGFDLIVWTIGTFVRDVPSQTDILI
jgi:hypothetical protein